MLNGEKRELEERIAYLEAKVRYLKRHCTDLIEGPSSASAAGDCTDLGNLLEAERLRAFKLSEELLHVKSHRDDIERQIKHQHEHVLYLTEKIAGLEAQLAGARKRGPGRLLSRLWQLSQGKDLAVNG